VGLVVSPEKKFANLLGIIAFIQANMLMPIGWLRATDGLALEGGFEKFNVVGVGATDRDTQRDAASIR
jgi:hypothetical protein